LAANPKKSTFLPILFETTKKRSQKPLTFGNRDSIHWLLSERKERRLYFFLFFSSREKNKKKVKKNKREKQEKTKIFLDFFHLLDRNISSS
jgi:hypothetical protein